MYNLMTTNLKVTPKNKIVHQFCNLLESGAVLSPNSFLYCAKKYDSFKLSIILWCILQNRLILVYKSAFQCGQKNNPSPRLSLCSILFFSTSSLA